MKQRTFAQLSYESKKRQTRREKFLSEMDQVVPWEALLSVLRPHYPSSGRRGRQPINLETKLRIYFMQQWYSLSDPMMEDALYEIESMRRFAGLELIDDALPDESTILRFRHFLQAHNLTAQLMNTINEMLESRGVLLQGGTMVDASLVHASPSTKNKARERDPEMKQTKKGNQWYFGMKVHIGADVNSGLVHSASVTAANESDISQMYSLLREGDRAVFGDKAYVNNEWKRAARAAGVFWGVSLKSSSKHRLKSGHQRRNRQLSSVRAKVEHVFRVMKCQFGYRKVRYRGLNKNAAQVFTLIGLSNLYLARERLLG